MQLVGSQSFRFIQNIVTYVLDEEKQRNRAIDKKLPLPFPCKCGVLCSNRELLRPVIRAFDRLYLEYMELQKEYSKLFQAAWIRRHEEKIYYSRRHPPPEVEPRIPFVIDEVFPFEDVLVDYWTQEAAKIAAEEVTGRTPDEKRLETIRVRMRYKSRSLLGRLTSWFLSIVYAYRDCTCFNCNYREALLDYRMALNNLQREYTAVYQQYMALISALKVLKPSPGENIKYILVRDLDALSRLSLPRRKKLSQEVEKPRTLASLPPPPPPPPTPPPLPRISEPTTKQDPVQILLDQCQCEVVTADITEDLR
ncbi:unnamed protein product [Schistocephalus solidus]|uniref:Uncharacterized protein n=1 Tax=Schistocephalus solidus TaxID=70667 RepID=A0A183T4M3_SCHSO|nr:unnamed protein product [Schistocephalus solidus]